MSCAEGTGCECGANCGDDVGVECAAEITVAGVPFVPFKLGWRRAARAQSRVAESRYTVKVDANEIPATVAITKNGIEVYCGTDPFEVLNTLYA